jgi:hypothetical protein
MLLLLRGYQTPLSCESHASPTPNQVKAREPARTAVRDVVLPWATDRPVLYVPEMIRGSRTEIARQHRKRTGLIYNEEECRVAACARVCFPLRQFPFSTDSSRTQGWVGEPSRGRSTK